MKLIMEKIIKDKIKSKLRIAILGIIFSIIIYSGFGFYKEKQIELVEEENPQIIIENVYKEVKINSVTPVKIEQELVPQKYLNYDVIAKLEIPKIQLETNVLKNYTIEGMKVCSSKFYGPEPNEIGNFCIAGHNTKRENMFNHLIDLEKGDELYLTDNNNGKIGYTIYNIYRVKPQNTSPIGQETNGNKIVTLITCVNYSKSRLIVQAIANN
ncbi:MAG: sortase [Clostridia bacterium]|nr:sortase [Clostridia bacterium]